jgi:hypothetical protein
MNYPTVHIQWVDPWSIDEWTGVEDIQDDAPVICTTGYLIKSTKKAYVVALNFNPDAEQVSCCIIIPRNAVRKLEHVERRGSGDDDTAV